VKRGRGKSSEPAVPTQRSKRGKLSHDDDDEQETEEQPDDKTAEPATPSSQQKKRFRLSKSRDDGNESAENVFNGKARRSSVKESQRPVAEDDEPLAPLARNKRGNKKSENLDSSSVEAPETAAKGKKSKASTAAAKAIDEISAVKDQTDNRKSRAQAAKVHDEEEAVDEDKPAGRRGRSDVPAAATVQNSEKPAAGKRGRPSKAAAEPSKVSKPEQPEPTGLLRRSAQDDSLVEATTVRQVPKRGKSFEPKEEVEVKSKRAPNRRGLSSEPTENVPPAKNEKTENEISAKKPAKRGAPAASTQEEETPPKKSNSKKPKNNKTLSTVDEVQSTPEKRVRSPTTARMTMHPIVGEVDKKGKPKGKNSESELDVSVASTTRGGRRQVSSIKSDDVAEPEVAPAVRRGRGAAKVVKREEEKEEEVEKDVPAAKRQNGRAANKKIENIKRVISESAFSFHSFFAICLNFFNPRTCFLSDEVSGRTKN
jgi:hypothetical protein